MLPLHAPGAGAPCLRPPPPICSPRRGGGTPGPSCAGAIYAQGCFFFLFFFLAFFLLLFTKANCVRVPRNTTLQGQAQAGGGSPDAGSPASRPLLQAPIPAPPAPNSPSITTGGRGNSSPPLGVPQPARKVRGGSAGGVGVESTQPKPGCPPSPPGELGEFAPPPAAASPFGVPQSMAP